MKFMYVTIFLGLLDFWSRMGERIERGQLSWLLVWVWVIKFTLKAAKDLTK